MNKVYYKNESKLVWYLLLVFTVAVVLTGYLLVNYFAWQLIPLWAIIGGKIYAISTNPPVAIVQLDDEGMTMLNEKLGNTFYAYEDILSIKMNSKALNGHLKLKSKKGKTHLDSVTIQIEDQREIVRLVTSKIGV